MELVKFREAKSIMKEKAFLQKKLERLQSGCLSRTELYFSSGNIVTFSEDDGEFYEGLRKNLEKSIREYREYIENRIGYLESKFDKL
jgi:uncharacterized protein YydD (DUF2326 family)